MSINARPTKAMKAEPPPEPAGSSESKGEEESPFPLSNRPTLSQLLLKDQVWPLATAWEKFCDVNPADVKALMAASRSGRVSSRAISAAQASASATTTKAAVAPTVEVLDGLVLLGSLTNHSAAMLAEYAARAVVAGFVAVTASNRYVEYCDVEELRFIVSFGLFQEPFPAAGVCVEGEGEGKAPTLKDRLSVVLRDPVDGPLVSEVLMREVTTSLANTIQARSKTTSAKVCPPSCW